jgi:hypothetical protein
MAKQEDVIARLDELEARVGKLESALGNASAISISREKKLSAKEFLIDKNVKSETQKVLALSYYLERIETIEPFNVPDLENVFRSAREKIPSNLNDAVNKNIAKGFLMEAKQKKDSKKAWNLTATGERYVESALK